MATPTRNFRFIIACGGAAALALLVALTVWSSSALVEMNNDLAISSRSSADGIRRAQSREDHSSKTSVGISPGRPSAGEESIQNHGENQTKKRKGEKWPSWLVTTVVPKWPGKPFKFACPRGTEPQACANFGSRSGIPTCAEPEPETQEVLNSFLLDCVGCLYVDIGCNTGYFAAHAAVLGATVECFEPTPNYCKAIRATAELNKVSSRVTVHNAGIAVGENNGTFTFKEAYSPCGMCAGPTRGGALVPWKAPLIPIRQVVAGRNVKFLKIDIDAHEGAILHTVASMIAKKETEVETILIEMGEGVAEWHCGDGPVNNRSKLRCPELEKEKFAKPRGGEINDVVMLQRKFGYDLYRVSIHVNREIYNWQGANANKHMAPQRKAVIPMFGVRNMRKLEKVPRTMSPAQVGSLFRFGTSFLFTKVQLAEAAKHHEMDLGNAKLTLTDLNVNNPALR